jgi:hypothetical protein
MLPMVPPDTRPMGLVEILKETFRVYSQNFLQFLRSVALVMVPFLVLEWFVRDWFFTLLMWVLIYPYGAVVWITFHILMEKPLSFARSYEYGPRGKEKPDVNSAITKRYNAFSPTKRNLGYFGMIAFLFIFLSLGTGLLLLDDFLLVVRLMMGWHWFAIAFTNFLVTGVLGLLLSLIVAWFVFTPQAIILGGEGFFSGLMVSVRLVKGSFWRVWGLLVVVFLPMFSLVYLLSLAEYLFIMILGVDILWSGLFYRLFSVLVFPLYGIESTLQFFDVLVWLESRGLEVRLQDWPDVQK